MTPVIVMDVPSIKAGPLRLPTQTTGIFTSAVSTPGAVHLARFLVVNDDNRDSAGFCGTTCLIDERDHTSLHHGYPALHLYPVAQLGIGSKRYSADKSRIRRTPNSAVMNGRSVSESTGSSCASLGLGLVVAAIQKGLAWEGRSTFVLKI